MARPDKWPEEVFVLAAADVVAVWSFPKQFHRMYKSMSKSVQTGKLPAW